MSGQGEMNFIEYPLGKIGTDQPTLLPIIKIPFPKNTNPVNIEIKTDTDTQTIGAGTAQTLVWHDSVTTEQAIATALLQGVSINSFNIINGGSGFSIQTTVEVTGGGGTGAIGEIDSVDSNGAILNIAVIQSGSGYTSTPTATVLDSPGSGEEIQVVLQSTSVASFTVTDGGRGYTSAPSVTVSDPDLAGVTATGTAVLTGSAVSSITLTEAGSGYTGTPTVTIGPPPGVEEPIIETSGTTLCMILFDGVTNLISGDIEIFATVAEDTIDDVTDELLYVSHGTLNTGEFLWPVTPIWLPLNKFLTINNASGANIITVNRVLTINFPKYP